MEEDELRRIDPLRLDRPYASQSELMQDIFSWLDLLLYYYYSRHRWLGPESELRNMLGLVISREEFEHNLSLSSRRGLARWLDEGEKRELALAEKAIRLRLDRTGDAFPLLLLRRRFALDDFAWKCVLLSYASASDGKYEKLLAYLQDDVTRKTPGAALVCELFLPEGEEYDARMASLRRRDGFLRLFDAEALERGSLELKTVTLEYLSTGTVSGLDGVTLFDGSEAKPDGPLVIGEDTARRLDALMGSPERCCILLTGAPGRGKRFQIEHLMRRWGERCVFADLEGDGWEERAETAALCARLTDAYLCCTHLDREDASGKKLPATPAMAQRLESLWEGRPKLFLLSENRVQLRERAMGAEIDLPPLTETERIELFRAFLDGAVLSGCTAEELSAKFRFTPRQISLACRQALGTARLQGDAALSGELLHRCCYRQAVHALGELASAVPAGGSWEDVVLPKAQIDLMRQACRHVRFRHLVYCRWGFERKVSYGRGLSVLFAGAPGTGKTMCAQVIARELNMEMYKINLAQVVSKYIGETEKNLRSVFTEARNANSVLFFDECDALFGKRSEVKDSHDRNANMETAYLLQQIEEYDGVCILATNLIGNIDAAFMRRMTYVVHFPFPDAKAREQIYRRMLPPEAPRADDIDWAFLAEKFEISGGHIKNIVLSAAFMAAGENRPLSMSHLLRACVNEMKKNEIVVVREQLRQYADLLEPDLRE